MSKSRLLKKKKFISVQLQNYSKGNVKFQDALQTLKQPFISGFYVTVSFKLVALYQIILV